MRPFVRTYFFLAALAICSRAFESPEVSAAPPERSPALAEYSNFKQLEARVEALRAGGVPIKSLASTRGERKVHLLSLGDFSESNRPAILVLGNTEAPFVLGSELALRVAELFAERADDQRVKQFYRRCSLYVIPRPDPDGTEKNLSKLPLREYAGNERATDDDRDFQTGEDGPDDLNGDGFISQMRVADDAGTHRLHPDDARILIPIDRSKNERGSYRIFTEGRDDDRDEQFNEDAGDGVSLQRNFPHRYPFFEVAAGPYAASEIETQSIIDFAFDHPRIAAVLSFTTDDNLMNPWKTGPAEGGKPKTLLQTPDAPYQNLLAEKYQKLHGGKDCPASPSGGGSAAQWAYFQYGRWSLAARGWWIPKIALDDEAKKKLSGETRGEDELNALRWFAREKREAFIPWQKVEHPDFPGRVVEVGGFQPHARMNPTASELPALAEKHFEYLLEVAELLPQLELRETHVERLGDGVFRVSVQVVNTGTLPTMPQMGQTTAGVPPLQIALDVGAEVKFLVGQRRSPIEPLEGQGGERKITWLVRAGDKGTLSGRIRVWAPNVGKAEVPLEGP